MYDLGTGDMMGIQLSLKGAQHPAFRPMFIVAKGLDGSGFNFNMPLCM